MVERGPKTTLYRLKIGMFGGVSSRTSPWYNKSDLVKVGKGQASFWNLYVSISAPASDGRGINYTSPGTQVIGYLGDTGEYTQETTDDVRDALLVEGVWVKRLMRRAGFSVARFDEGLRMAIDQKVHGIFVSTLGDDLPADVCVVEGRLE